MLWKHYIFFRGNRVHDLWDQLFLNRPIRLLYIAGRGFDIRVINVLTEFLDNIKSSSHSLERAKLLLIHLDEYEYSDELNNLTSETADELNNRFKEIGQVQEVKLGGTLSDGDNLSPSNKIKSGVEDILSNLTDETDIILDVSSLPRVVYLTLITSILAKLVPDKKVDNPLFAKGVNFQVLVAEDAALDSKIKSEELNPDVVFIPGFSAALHAEYMQKWPLVWFPVLGEHRLTQFDKVISIIPNDAEICPVVPHPSDDPRRADRLLIEYRVPLFEIQQIPTSNILYVHERNPFEAYRQLLMAMERYRNSLKILDGCRLVVTPLASKLITIGVGLACFEMKPTKKEENYGIAIPYAEPRRYTASIVELKSTRPEIASLLLTGNAYGTNNDQ